MDAIDLTEGSSPEGTGSTPMTEGIPSEPWNGGIDADAMEVKPDEDNRQCSVPSFDITTGGKLDYDFLEPSSGVASDYTQDLETPTNRKNANGIGGRNFNPHTVEDSVLACDEYKLISTKACMDHSVSSKASEENNALQSSEKVLTPYNQFLERLKHPSCMDIIRAVKGLIAMLPGKKSRSEATSIIHNFIDIYTPKLLSVEAFSGLAEDDCNMSAEFFEKFTMQKLYPQCYSMDPKDRIEDEKLWIKIRCLEWVEPAHLEISSEVDENMLKEAQVQLNRISKFKAPRDKLVGILNCCRLVVHSLENSSNKPASADETLPLLIYVTIKANPHELWSSIEYIQHFRHPSRHIAEEAYGFTLLVSAVEYIKSLGITTHFKMDIEEFKRLFQEAQEPYMSRIIKLNEAQPSEGLDGDMIFTGLGNMSMLNRLKKIAQPARLFKSMILKNLASTEIHDAVEALSALEAYMMDIPLVFKPDQESTTEAAGLLSDWRALIAMREVALDTVSKVKTLLSNAAL